MASFLRKHVCRTGQPEMIAEGLAFIFGSEQSAPLELRYNQFDEEFRSPRQVGWKQDEPVRRALLEPFFESIGNCLGIAHDFSAASAATKIQKHLANGDTVGPET